MTDVRENLVAGAWVGDGRSGYADDVNPSNTADVIARIPQFSPEQAAAAVTAAADAFRSWRSMSAVSRGEVLIGAAQKLRERADEVADLLRREAGKPQTDALGEVLKSAQFLEYYGGMGRAAFGEVLPDVRPGVFSHTRVEPLGVVVAITPWNDPLLTPARKLGPALITGNTVVLKPASVTPIVSQELARAFADAGMPAGVLNVVTGSAAEVGPVLTDNPLVNAISFTGSTEVGLALRSQLAGAGIRLQTEMGGKNAIVVLPDADLSLVASTVVAAAFGGVGQRCTATSRLITIGESSESVRSSVLAAMSERLVVGPTDATDTTFGPVISEAHMTSVLGFIDRAKEQGGTVLTGGSRRIDAPFDAGYFVEPTVIEVDTSANLWRDEVFGPVLAVASAPSIDEAVDLVNQSNYGLSAGIFTRDLSAAFAFADRVDTGQVAVNLPTSGWDAHLPFGGFKDSGSLFKEQGTAALGFYTKLKTVSMKVG